MSEFVETQMDDADRRGLDYSLAPTTCPDCGHESHAGRCHFVATPKGHYIQCNCKKKREAPDDTDRRDDRHDPSVGAPAVRPADGIRAGLGSVEHEARLQLARKGVKLSGFAEDLLHEIGEIGQTMTDGAARLRGDGA
jgi:hypothetical protein